MAKSVRSFANHFLVVMYGSNVGGVCQFGHGYTTVNERNEVGTDELLLR